MPNEPLHKPGPNTPDGKANSSKNATKHGLRGNPDKPLPGETQEEFDAVREPWEAEYPPTTPGIEPLLSRLINADRRFRRASAAADEAETAIYEDDRSSEEKTGKLHKTYQLMLRYQTQHDRALRQALRDIEQFRTTHFREIMALRRQEELEYKNACTIAFRCEKHGVPPGKLLYALPLKTPMPTRQPPIQPEKESDPLP